MSGAADDGPPGGEVGLEHELVRRGKTNRGRPEAPVWFQTPGSCRRPCSFRPCEASCTAVHPQGEMQGSGTCMPEGCSDAHTKF